MNKFDKSSNDQMLRIMSVESRHPRQEELPTQRFPSWSQPAVTFNDQNAVAVGWTKSYGLVQFVDPEGERRLEWVAAGLIKRV